MSHSYRGRPALRAEARARAHRLRTLRLARTFALGVTALVVAISFGLHGGGPSAKKNASPASLSTVPAQAPGGPYAIGERKVIYTDASRRVHYGNGTSGPRELVTTLIYPASGNPSAKAPVDGAAPYRPGRPYPLVVFAPGYEKDPSTYQVLLNTWARAGYVVAGVTFPLTNPNVPGGPNEEDIVNQPADLSFVIGKVIAQAATSGNFLSGMVDPARVAVAGHSDGGDSAMAVAFDTCCRDSVIRAAIILSGAELNLPGGSYYPAGSPPLLAVQGTSDTVNNPSFTQSLYEADTVSPKYELLLQGAGPLEAYSQSGSYEKVVAKVTVDFLDAYLKGSHTALGAITSDGMVSGVSSIVHSLPASAQATSTTNPTTSSPPAPATSASTSTVTTTSLPPGVTTTTVFIPTLG